MAPSLKIWLKICIEKSYNQILSVKNIPLKSQIIKILPDQN